MKRQSLALCLLFGSSVLLAADPMPPTNIRVALNGSDSVFGPVILSWNNAVDDGYITGYYVHKNSEVNFVGNVNEYRDFDIEANMVYRYRVKSIDNEGNLSRPSPEVVVGTGISALSGTGTLVSASASSGSSGGTENTETSSVEICIDADGDGWGWNGSESCLINDQGILNLNQSLCIDPDGDGWGWNGFESCLVPATIELRICVDNDGDGWGWNGIESCEP